MIRPSAGRGRLTVAQYCAPGSVTTAELGATFADLLELDWWPRRFDGGLTPRPR